MSPRRWFGGALLLAALGMTSPSRPSGAGAIVARVGGNLAGRVGDTLNVPLTVDMTGSGGARLGSYRLILRWNPQVMYFEAGSNGTFAEPFVNSDSAGYGVLRMTAIQPSGADGVITLGVGHFVVTSDTGASDITLAFQELTAVAPTFDDLLPMLTVVNGTFCHATGRWGDADGDGQANSRDALIALSRVVGIVRDTMKLDTLYTDTAGVHTAWRVLMRPGLTDVDADGQVTSRDALIIMSYAVGLPVTGFRIGLAAAGGGSCGSGIGLTLAVAPDTLELQTGQMASAQVTARDSAGNPASLNGATWTSSNTAVAGIMAPGFGILARDPGIATLTVQLGAGYRASMVVKVIAHRSQWYVDVARAEAAVQTGSQRFPFPFISDAFSAGRDGDTINVAPGTYEESVSSDISVFLRGDPANLPVIDPRGAPYYTSSTPALYAGSRVAPMRIENLKALHGRVEIYSHDFYAKNLQIEADPSIFEPLYFESAVGLLPGPVPAGVRPGAADLPYDTGSVVLDSVSVHNWDWNGIQIQLADTVIIRNSRVWADSTTFTACNGNGPSGIYVNVANRTDISGTTVQSSPCAGIAVDQQHGNVRFSGNRIDRTAGFGIVANGDSIAFDHNLVTRIISGDWTAMAGGLVTLNSYRAPAVTSLGDVIRNSGDRAFVLNGARQVRIDSLTVDTAGLDGTNTAAGVEFWGGRLLITNSRISDVLLGGSGILAWTPDTSRSVTESRRNVIRNVGGPGLYATQYTPGAGCAPPFFGAAPVERGAMGGCGGIGPDTLISVGDSILFPGYSGIRAEGGERLFVDSAVVDSAGGNGVDASSVTSVQVSRSAIRRPYSSGIQGQTIQRLVVDSVVVDSVGGNGIDGWYILTAQILGSVIRKPFNNGVNLFYSDSVLVARSAISGAFYGINANGLTTWATILGSSIDSSSNTGVNIYSPGGTGPVPLVVDSSRILGNGNAGLDARCDIPCTKTASVTRSTVAGNLMGLVTEGYQVTARGNNIAGNMAAGAANFQISFAVMDADSNWWGDSNGPACVPTVTGCAPTTAGDTIASQSITFANWLTAPASGVMPAPRNLRPVARRDVPLAAARAMRPASAAVTRPSAAAAPQRTMTLRSERARPQPPRGPLMTWRKGHQPEPATVHHPS